MKIRIAVVTLADGKWAAVGDSQWSDERTMAEAAGSFFADATQRITWVTADVPLPEPVAEVAGEVEG